MASPYAGPISATPRYHPLDTSIILIKLRPLKNLEKTYGAASPHTKLILTKPCYHPFLYDLLTPNIDTLGLHSAP